MDIDMSQLPLWVQVLSLILTGGGVYFGVWFKNKGTVQQVVDNSIRSTIERQDAKITSLEASIKSYDDRVEQLQETTRKVLASLSMIEAQAMSIRIHIQTYTATIDTAPSLAAKSLDEVERGFEDLFASIKGLQEDTQSREEAVP